MGNASDRAIDKNYERAMAHLEDVILNGQNDQNSAPAAVIKHGNVRFISYTQDGDSKDVYDISEVDAPDTISGSKSFTAISKDKKRRQMMVAMAELVDQILNDEIDHFLVCTSPKQAG